MRITHPLRGERGVSLTELAITVGLFGMIMVGVVGTWQKTQEAYFVGSEAAEVQQNIRAAMDFMVRELRATGRDVTVCTFDYQGFSSQDCTAAKIADCAGKLAGFVTCANQFAVPAGDVLVTRIRVRADRNDNGRVELAEEDVTYEYMATSPPCPSNVPACIVRTSGAGTVAMVGIDINSLTFTYFPRPGFPPCAGAAFWPQGATPCPEFAIPLADETVNGRLITAQEKADNIGRVRINIIAFTTIGDATVRRTLQTDVILKNRN